jgi:hypothetical protein
MGFVVSLGHAVTVCADALRRSWPPCQVTVDMVLDAGHASTGVGMAYMFAPTSMQLLQSSVPAGFFLTLALLFLGMSMTRPCLWPPRRSSCILLMAESLAMAYMFAFTSWESTDITNGLQLLFGGVVTVTAARLALLRRRTLPADVSVTALGRRLVMGSGMLTMLTLAHPM